MRYHLDTASSLVPCHCPLKDIDKMDQVWQRDPNWSGLEKLSWEKRLRDWDLLSLKKRWLQEEPNSSLPVPVRSSSKRQTQTLYSGK